MAHYDLIIAGIASMSLILLIMMFITRSLVAALVIVGTVALSLGASIGLSVLVWQHLLGIPLYWVILPLAVILLLAVGSDYNLLLVSRFKEEIHAGINTGIIRSMAGSGSVVTAAGLVFAFTMASFIFSDLLRAGPDRHDDRARFAVRHADRPVVHDAVDRRVARAVVLVAGASAPTAGAAEVRRRGHAAAVVVLVGRPVYAIAAVAAGCCAGGEPKTATGTLGDWLAAECKNGVHRRPPLIVIKTRGSSLSGNTVNFTYASRELLHHFFMSRATGEVAPG